MSNSFEVSKFHPSTVWLAKERKMESKTKTPNTTNAQFKILVEFMKGHEELAKGHLKSVNAKNAAYNLWKRLADDLNAAGPPSRDIAGWKKVWSDYKTHLKAKMLKNRLSLGGTGGGPSTFCALTAMEEDVAKLLSMEDSMTGESGALHFGGVETVEYEAEPQNVEYIVLNNETEKENTTPPLRLRSRSRSRCHSRSRIQPSSTREQLLKIQVDSTTEYQRKVCSQLEELNGNIKRMREISEKEYQLKKDKFKHKKKMDIEKLQVKKENIELRRQELDLKTNKLYLK